MKRFTKILLGLAVGLILNFGCGVSALLQCGDEVPCDFGAQGSSTTVLGQTSESSVNTGDGNRFNTANDPHYSGERVLTEDQSSTDVLTVDTQISTTNFRDENFTALLEFDPFLMSVFGLEDIPFLLSSYFDNLLIDSLAPSGGGFRDMTFLERLCIQEGFPEFQCRQRYGR